MFKSVTDSLVESHPSVREIFEARRNFGLAKYGTELTINNGRDFLKDAYEELIDLMVYIHGFELENQRNLVSDEEWRMLQALLARFHSTLPVKARLDFTPQPKPIKPLTRSNP